MSQGLVALALLLAGVFTAESVSLLRAARRRRAPRAAEAVTGRRLGLRAERRLRQRRRSDGLG